MRKSAQKHPIFHTFIKVWIWPRPSPSVKKIHTFFLKASLISLKHVQDNGCISFHTETNKF